MLVSHGGVHSKPPRVRGHPAYARRQAARASRFEARAAMLEAGAKHPIGGVHQVRIIVAMSPGGEDGGVLHAEGTPAQEPLLQVL